FRNRIDQYLGGVGTSVGKSRSGGSDRRQPDRRTVTMLRTEALEALARYRKDMITLVTMRAVEPWEALGETTRRTFNVMGCMGAAASIGLGLAIAQPNERVLIIDGDG